MVIFTANPILSKYVRLCPRFSPFFPGFPENRAEFLTFLRQSFFHVASNRLFQSDIKHRNFAPIFSRCLLLLRNFRNFI